MSNAKELMEKIEKRKKAKITINRYTLLPNKGGVSEDEYKKALVDALFTIEPKNKTKSNPFNLVFNTDGSINFKESFKERKMTW